MTRKKYPKKQMPNVPNAVVDFGRFLHRIGELKKDDVFYFFEKPYKYQKLWDAWSALRKDFDDWQIERKISDILDN